MESIKDTIFKIRPDAKDVIRKLYGLDQPKALNDAIEILQEWTQKQDHFLKKDFDRDFLERLILRSKGSIEISKQRLDKMCTSRTLLSTYFTSCAVKLLPSLEDVEDAYLPRQTHDFYRVYLLRNVGQKFEDDFHSNFFKRIIQVIEFGLRHDYFVGVVMILDFRKSNLVALLRNMNLVEVQQMLSMITECYGYRMKGIHMLSNSKVIDSLVGIFKQFLSAKVGGRVHVHSTLESLHEHVEKDILPEEYGGTEVSLTELHKNLMDVLSTEEHLDYMKMMNAAGTNEALRQTDKYNEQVLGMPGSFRSLQVD